MVPEFKPAILLVLVMTVITGLAYPLAVTGISGLAFPDQARGSLVLRDGKPVGSAVIGQNFARADYFHPRPSAAGEQGYDASSSGATNLAITDLGLIQTITERVRRQQAENPVLPVPIDLVTSSGSGLDPHITPAAALFQVPRVARARGVTDDWLRSQVMARVEGRLLGLFGEPRVNVLLLNLALDAARPATGAASERK